MVLVTCATFLPALDGEFLDWDDTVNIVNNSGYRGLGWQQLRWMFTTTLMGHYIPLTWLTFGINYDLGGMNPRGYHLGNLLVHTANTLLFYFVSTRLLAAGGRAVAGEARIRLGAAFAALLFGVHPLRVESVAWITERRDVLCGSFFLLAVLAYLRGLDGAATLPPRWRAASLLAFGAALLSKAAAVPLPAALLVLDLYPLRRGALGWRRLLVEKVPYALLAAAAALVALLALQRGVVVTGYDRYGPAARLAMVAYGVVFYPLKFLWPASLSPMYELPLRVDPLAWPYSVAMATALAITAALALLRHRCPGGLATWAYSALMILPVSGVVHSGAQLVNDRYSYLSGLGLAVLAGYGLLRMLSLPERARAGRWVGTAAGAGATLLVVTLGIGAWSQSHVWHDSETLWRWAVEQDPGCALCHAKLGAAIFQGPGGGGARAAEAESHLRRAIALRPDAPTPHFNLGTLLLVRGQYPEAERALLDYIRLTPTALDGAQRLGLLYVLQGRAREAVALLGQTRGSAAAAAVSRRPGADSLAEIILLLGDNVENLQYLGQALIEGGRAAEAVEPLSRAVALRPDAAAPRFWLARAHGLAGNHRQLEEQMAVLQRLDPLAARRLQDEPVRVPGGR